MPKYRQVWRMVFGWIAGQCLDKCRGRCALLRPGWGSAWEDIGAGTGGQSDLWRTEKEPALYYGYHFFVRRVCRGERSSTPLVADRVSRACGIRKVRVSFGGIERMVTEQARVIQLNRSDDVFIACQDVPAGTLLDEYGLTVRDAIPAGHKIAIRDIASGEPVRRYNQIIGFASEPISAGEHVHVHNLKVQTFRTGLCLLYRCQADQLRSSRRNVPWNRSGGWTCSDTKLSGSFDHG